jgi:hypothetical protein
MHDAAHVGAAERRVTLVSSAEEPAPDGSLTGASVTVRDAAACITPSVAVRVAVVTVAISSSLPAVRP